MPRLRQSQERGHGAHGWLDSRHTFSFADYHDPAWMAFRNLRVMNEDRVQPGRGFGLHGHREMEILSYVLSGELAHRDSLGHESILHAGEWQQMTAGTGIRHSEFNPSASEPAHFYQIWLLPNQPGLAPSYEQRKFEAAGQVNRWQTVAAPDGQDGSLTLHADCVLRRAHLTAGASLSIRVSDGRGGWLQVLSGAVRVAETTLRTGDGWGIDEAGEWLLYADAEAEILWFDLA